MSFALRVVALPLVLLGLFAVPAEAGALKTAKAVIARQVQLIKAGNVAALKKGFTARVQDRITEASVKKAQHEIGSMTIDDLVASASDSKTAIKIKMKNGRTLTTLVKVDGAWLADTLWFR